MLPREEWLADAQHLAIGASNRVYHGAEHRRNLVVWNKQDRWECWCHACNDGAVVFKEHVQMRPQEPPPPVLHTAPTLLLAPDLPDIHKHLHEKGVSLTLLRDFNPQYSPTDKRIVLQSGGTMLGRDMTGRSPMKWCHYYGPRFFLAGSTGTLVLTEDVYSAIKIKYYANQDPRVQTLGGVQALACMGTGLGAPQRAALMQSSACIRWFDPDAAGQKADTLYSRACRAFGIPSAQARNTRACDPKNHTPQEIKDIVYAALCTL